MAVSGTERTSHFAISGLSAAQIGSFCSARICPYTSSLLSVLGILISFDGSHFLVFPFTLEFCLTSYPPFHFLSFSVLLSLGPIASNMVFMSWTVLFLSSAPRDAVFRSLLHFFVCLFYSFHGFWDQSFSREFLYCLLLVFFFWHCLAFLLLHKCCDGCFCLLFPFCIGPVFFFLPKKIVDTFTSSLLTNKFVYSWNMLPWGTVWYFNSYSDQMGVH